MDTFIIAIVSEHRHHRPITSWDLTELGAMGIGWHATREPLDREFPESSPKNTMQAPLALSPRAVACGTRGMLLVLIKAAEATLLLTNLFSEWDLDHRIINLNKR